MATRAFTAVSMRCCELTLSRYTVTHESFTFEWDNPLENEAYDIRIRGAAARTYNSHDH